MAALFILLLTLLGSIPLAFFGIPLLVQTVGAVVGNRLRIKTAQRKELFQRKSLADRARQEQQRKAQPSQDDDWEKVGPSRHASDAQAKDGLRMNEDWDGVIGFLHPFW